MKRLNAKKDLLRLANAILIYTEMPPSKNEIKYLAEVVAPLAADLKDRYTPAKVKKVKIKKAVRLPKASMPKKK